MNTEQKILKALKDYGRLPTGRVAAIIGMNYHRALKKLQVMWEQGFVYGEVETIATYWKLKEKKGVNE